MLFNLFSSGHRDKFNVPSEALRPKTSKSFVTERSSLACQCLAGLLKLSLRGIRNHEPPIPDRVQIHPFAVIGDLDKSFSPRVHRLWE